MNCHECDISLSLSLLLFAFFMFLCLNLVLVLYLVFFSSAKEERAAYGQLSQVFQHKIAIIFSSIS